MAKISKGDLEIGRGWVAFFERLGWDFYDFDPVDGTARRDTGSRKAGKDGKTVPIVKEVTIGERHDIEATWRENEPANVAKIGAA